MGDNAKEVEAALRPVDTLIPPKDSPASQLTALPTPAPKSDGPLSAQVEAGSQRPASDQQPATPTRQRSFRDFKAGDIDPLVGVKTREVLIGTEDFLVYIDVDFTLHWRWTSIVNSSSAAPVFSRAGSKPGSYRV
jgi:hypothetical protein